MEDHDVSEWGDIEESAQCQFRAPDPAPDQPICGGKVLRRPTAAHLHDGYPIAFFGQAMGGHTATESGANHDEIEVAIRVGHGCSTGRAGGAAAGTNGGAAFR